MTQTNSEAVKNSRKSKLLQGEQLTALKDLRKRGVLTRQQFRLQCFDKGLLQNTNREPFSPLYTHHEMVKNKKTGEKTVVTETRQWVRYSK